MKKVLIFFTVLAAFTGAAFASFTSELPFTAKNNYSAPSVVAADSGAMFFSYWSGTSATDTGIYYFKNGLDSPVKIFNTKVLTSNLQLRQALKGGADTYIVLADSGADGLRALYYNASTGDSGSFSMHDTFGKTHKSVISGNAVYTVIAENQPGKGETVAIIKADIKALSASALQYYDTGANPAPGGGAVITNISIDGIIGALIKSDSLYIGYAVNRDAVYDSYTMKLIRQSVTSSSDSAVTQVNAGDNQTASGFTRPYVADITLAGDTIVSIIIGVDTTAVTTATDTGLYMYFHNAATLAHKGYVRCDTGFEAVLTATPAASNYNRLFAVYDSANKFHIAFKGRESAAAGDSLWYGTGSVSPAGKGSSSWSDTEQVYSSSTSEVPKDNLWGMAVDSSKNVWFAAQDNSDGKIRLYKRVSESSSSSGSGCVIENLANRSGASFFIAPLRKTRDIMMETTAGRKLTGIYYKIR